MVMPPDETDSSRPGSPQAGPAGADAGAAADTSAPDPFSTEEGAADRTVPNAAEAVEKKLEVVGAAALVTVTMAVQKALASSGEAGLSETQRSELAQVRDKLATSLDALDAQSRRGGLAQVDLGGLRRQIVRAIGELDRHLLPDHPGQHSGAYEVLPS